MAIQGTGGYISIEGAGNVCDITDWTIHINVDEIEITPVSAETWRKFTPGLINATAEFTSYSNYLLSDLSPQDAVELTFYTPDGATFSCDTSFLTSAIQSVNVLGLVTYTYTVRFGGVLTIT